MTKNYHRCCAISHFLVLKLSQLNQDFGRWVLNLQQVQNGSPVIGDGHILQQSKKK